MRKTMNLSTSRFGEISISEDEIIIFPEGIPGFEHTRQYVLVPHKACQGRKSPFRWLQSIEEPGLALPVINPWAFRPDYAPTVPGPMIKQLGITDVWEQAQFLAVVTIPSSDPSSTTVNLLAPILINRQTKVAKQVIIQNECYSIRTPLVGGLGEIVNSGRKFALAAA
jgi:flagellar assembly factor FliW